MQLSSELPLVAIFSFENADNDALLAISSFRENYALSWEGTDHCCSPWCLESARLCAKRLALIFLLNFNKNPVKGALYFTT